MKVNNNLEVDFFPPRVIFIDRMGEKLSFYSAFDKMVIRLANYLLDFWLMILGWVTWSPFWSIRKFFFIISGLKIGTGSKIHTGVTSFNPTGIAIGRDTIIGFRCFLDGRAPLKIGNHVDIASEVMIYNSEHDVHSEDMRAIKAPVVIEDYVFVGPRVIILPGVTI